MVKPPKKPEKKPTVEEQILQVLIMIWDAIGRTNRILKHTEARNEKRHLELLKALASDDASKIEWRKVRREQIP